LQHVETASSAKHKHTEKQLTLFWAFVLAAGTAGIDATLTIKGVYTRFVFPHGGSSRPGVFAQAIGCEQDTSSKIRMIDS
jgi:hypothetical protein